MILKRGRRNVRICPGERLKFLLIPTPALPEHATDASRARLDLALQLADGCPREFAAAIALTGSSARGLAEAESDAEINFWAEALPSQAARAGWLIEAGVTALEAEPAPRSDESEWFSGSFSGVDVEIGWQTLDALARSLAPVCAALTVDPARLRLGELLVSAVVLRADVRLLDLQHELALYPDELRDALIAQFSGQLADRAQWQTITRLAQRGERLGAVYAVVEMLRAALRLLYAVNRRWEAGDKWLLTLAADFPVMPEDWRARLDAALAATPGESAALARAWCDDALDLAG